MQLTKAAIASVTGKEPAVTAIHAGLECGILGERLPGCDMVRGQPLDLFLLMRVPSTVSSV